MEVHRMAGKFELYKDKSGEFRFRLKAGNGEVIATSSESYKTKASALNGIESIKKNAAEANLDDQTD
ncbi:YegP family protein [Kribbella sp. NPDC051137]